jgi:anti-sigma-K factor RskA
VNVNDYISSGILELYAAGALPSEEAREVEAMAASYPEIASEIDEIQAAMELFASSERRNPRPELREIILDRIAEIEEKESSTRPAAMPANVIPLSPPVVRQKQSRARYLMAASIAFALLCAASALYMGMRWQRAETELAEVSRQNQQIAEENDAMKTSLDRTQQQMAIISSADNRIVRMEGLQPAPDALAVVYWNPRTREVYLDAGSLPPTPPGREYQLWAIRGKTPVDAGVFIKATGLHRMKSIESADAFAVTLEPTGGSPTPTMNAMYVLGKL